MECNLDDLEKALDFMNPNLKGAGDYPLVNLAERRIKIGFAVMDKKFHSKAMKKILSQLKQFQEFEFLTIGNDMLLNKPIEEWPGCDCLITFYADKFPFSKVIRYVDKYKPFMLNDIYYQKLLWDRRVIHAMLRLHNIPSPPHHSLCHQIQNFSMVDCDDTEYNEEEMQIKLAQDKLYNKNAKELCLIDMNSVLPLKAATIEPTHLDIEYEEGKEEAHEHEPEEEERIEEAANFIEYENSLVIDSYKLDKPLVEKPINAEDHNIYIYYPSQSGGGSKRLFRKIGDLSSKFFPYENYLRKTGVASEQFLYERYLPTQGFDIKVYTVGKEYYHAEARKSPTLDGVVQREEDGAEVRYPVLMTTEEKEIARKIVTAFKQRVTGFDLLRFEGKSYVCDVNGWAFVKGNERYYNDCALEFRRVILETLCPSRLEELKSKRAISISENMHESYLASAFMDKSPDEPQEREELRSVVAVFRHADRTPKQKMKMSVSEKEFLQFFKYAEITKEGKIKQVKLKTPKRLQKLLDATIAILEEENLMDDSDHDHARDRVMKLVQLRVVLQQGGHFEGINRKVQFRPLKIREAKGRYRVTEALLILKWGGGLTHAGWAQAIKLGRDFRKGIYPTGSLGLLRLHSTYRHDLKCYSSDEGRCLKTAAGFLKGMLDLEGEFTPIAISMVRSDADVGNLLDENENALPELMNVKNNLEKMLNYDGDLLEKYLAMFPSQLGDHLISRITKIGNPKKMLEEIHSLISTITRGIRKLLVTSQKTKSYLISGPMGTEEDTLELSKLYLMTQKSTEEEKKMKESLKDSPYVDRSRDSLASTKKIMSKALSELNEEDRERACGCERETLICMYKRWMKLDKDFLNKSSRKYDISKIPDVYDSIKYDEVHNSILSNPERKELMRKIAIMNSFVTPMEYGIVTKQKLKIGMSIIDKLLHKMHHDLIWWSESEPKKTGEEEIKTEEDCKLEEEKEEFWNRTEAKTHNIKQSAWKHVRTRLYFTSASHLYTLFNTLHLGLDSMLMDPSTKNKPNPMDEINRLDYLSHIIFRLYENSTVSEEDPKRFRLELLMSPGCNGNPLLIEPEDHALPVTPHIVINKHLTIQDLDHFFTKLTQLDYAELKKNLKRPGSLEIPPRLGTCDSPGFESFSSVEEEKIFNDSSSIESFVRLQESQFQKHE